MKMAPERIPDGGSSSPEAQAISELSPEHIAKISGGSAPIIIVGIGPIVAGTQPK